MFNSLTTKFSSIFSSLKGKKNLNKYDIDEAMKEIKSALIEADVAISVINQLIENISAQALGEEVYKSTTTSQTIIKIVNDELVNLIGSEKNDAQLNLVGRRPANILMVGLQGSGKTTFSAKIAKFLQGQNKKVLLVSLDTYRPAAQEQLKILADSISVDSLEIIQNQNPIDIAKRAAKQSQNYDVVIYDSAGRLHIDEALINELKSIKEIINPTETLLTVDALMGQDAANIARDFNDKISVTGNLLSKLDGDSRGGAALSIRYITDKPIKFLGIGEKIDDIEIFEPEKMVNRILDKGDIVELVKKAQEVINEEDAEKSAKRMQQGKFDLNDYLNQIQSVKKMGGMSKLLKFIPGASQLESRLNNSPLNDKSTAKQEAIILSMTKKERSLPKILNMSRKNRIIKGSGSSMSDLNKLLKQYEKIHSTMKKMGKMDPQALMSQIKGKFGM